MIKVTKEPRGNHSLSISSRIINGWPKKWDLLFQEDPIFFRLTILRGTRSIDKFILYVFWQLQPGKVILFRTNSLLLVQEWG